MALGISRVLLAPCTSGRPCDTHTRSMSSKCAISSMPVVLRSPAQILPAGLVMVFHVGPRRTVADTL